MPTMRERIEIIRNGLKAATDPYEYYVGAVPNDPPGFHEDCHADYNPDHDGRENARVRGGCGFSFVMASNVVADMDPQTGELEIVPDTLDEMFKRHMEVMTKISDEAVEEAKERQKNRTWSDEEGRDNVRRSDYSPFGRAMVYWGGTIEGEFTVHDDEPATTTEGCLSLPSPEAK